MRGSPHEHALLAYRWLHCADGQLWAEFPRYWMAFNALYNAVRQAHESEATAVMNVIRIFMDSAAAETCLEQIGRRCISELIATPPGDDRLDPTDPLYRRKTSVLAAYFQGNGEAVERLAALMRIVYQVRCNLVHGSKDPIVMRDQALVSSCTPIVKVVVARLEKIMEQHHDVPTLSCSSAIDSDRLTE
jgi:hypothetical protein